MPNHERRKSSENPSAIFATGSPLVLVVTIVPGLRMASTFFSSDRLISRFSTMASMIQSTSARRFRSSSKFPTVTSRESEASKNAAGFDFRAPSSPAAAILLRAGPSRVRRDDIEQQGRHSGVGEMCRDAGAHGARAEDSDFVNAFHKCELLQ